MQSGGLRYVATVSRPADGGDGRGGRIGAWVPVAQLHCRLMGLSRRDRLTDGLLMADDVVRIEARNHPGWTAGNRVEIAGQRYVLETVDVYDNGARLMMLARRSG